VFIEAKDDGGGGDNWSYMSCTAPVKSSPPTNQHPVFTGRMPVLSPNQALNGHHIIIIIIIILFNQPIFLRSFQFKPGPTKENPWGVAVLDFYRLDALSVTQRTSSKD